MRQYRGRRKDNGEWVYGYLIGKDVIVGDIVEFCEEYFNCEYWWKVDPETVGQYTGLKDRDDRDIYEGDILIDEENGLNVVRWGDGQYLLEVLLDDGDYYTEWLSEYNEMCRVIGNVYENPELLKGEETA